MKKLQQMYLVYPHDFKNQTLSQEHIQLKKKKISTKEKKQISKNQNNFTTWMNIFQKLLKTKGTNQTKIQKQIALESMLNTIFHDKKNKTKNIHATGDMLSKAIQTDTVNSFDVENKKTEEKVSTKHDKENKLNKTNYTAMNNNMERTLTSDLLQNNIHSEEISDYESSEEPEPTVLTSLFPYFTRSKAQHGKGIIKWKSFK